MELSEGMGDTFILEIKKRKKNNDEEYMEAAHCLQSYVGGRKRLEGGS